jgi:hypothetical protein
LGLIARPVVAGVEDVDEEADEVLEEVDEVDEAEEDAEEVVAPALSCLIKSAARSAWPSVIATKRKRGTYQSVKDRHQMGRNLER